MQTQSHSCGETLSSGKGLANSASAFAAMTIEPDGSIVVMTEWRCDTATVAGLTAVIAEELRIPTDRVHVEPVEGDSSCGVDSAPLSSNLRAAAAAVRGQLLRRASARFDMAASELLLNDGRVITLDGRAITYQEIAGCPCESRRGLRRDSTHSVNRGSLANLAAYSRQRQMLPLVDLAGG